MKNKSTITEPGVYFIDVLNCRSYYSNHKYMISRYIFNFGCSKLTERHLNSVGYSKHDYYFLSLVSKRH